MEHPHTHDIGAATLPVQASPEGHSSGADLLADLVSDLTTPGLSELVEATLQSSLVDGIDPVPSVGAESGSQEATAAVDPLRGELVTAEVAAVLALIAHDYFTERPEARGHGSRTVSLASRLQVRKTHETAREATSGGGCQIIAFPGPRR